MSRNIGIGTIAKFAIDSNALPASVPMPLTIRTDRGPLPPK